MISGLSGFRQRARFAAVSAVLRISLRENLNFTANSSIQCGLVPVSYAASEDYANALRELAKFRTATAHKVFAAPEQMDEAQRARYEQPDELKRAQFWELTGGDYERFRNSGEDPSKAAMLAQCPP